jgi:hypothetical protein
LPTGVEVKRFRLKGETLEPSFKELKLGAVELGVGKGGRANGGRKEKSKDERFRFWARTTPGKPIDSVRAIIIAQPKDGREDMKLLVNIIDSHS